MFSVSGIRKLAFLTSHTLIKNSWDLSSTAAVASACCKLKRGIRIQIQSYVRRGLNDRLMIFPYRIGR